MSQDYLAKSEDSKLSVRRRAARAIGFVLWVAFGFFAAQFLVLALAQGLAAVGVSFDQIDETVFSASVAAVVYVLAIAIVVLVPHYLKKAKTTKKELGIERLPSWGDIGFAPVVFIAYIFLSGIIVQVATNLLPWIDMNQVQDVGFKGLYAQYEYILAFVTLVVVAPIAEEVLFRGYLFGKLRKLVPFWAAALLVSVLFGAAHGQWNVAIDTFVLSMALCFIREKTGALWVSILVHMIKNGIAFYLLFVNTSLLQMIGG